MVSSIMAKHEMAKNYIWKCEILLPSQIGKKLPFGYPPVIFLSYLWQELMPDSYWRFFGWQHQIDKII